MTQAVISVLLAMQFIFVGFANAAPVAMDSNIWQDCLKMQNNVSSEQELECYRQEAQVQQALSLQAESQTAAVVPSSIEMRSKTLAEEWTPVMSVPLRIYKPNYFIATHTAYTNNAPTSANPLNQVPYTYPLDHNEVKFQISIKTDLIDLSPRQTLWVAYTQKSFWQIFENKHSKTFRESNYEPQLIYSYRPKEMGTDAQVVASFINVAVVHQSNGQTLPKSRGWNSMYLQVGLEHDFGSTGRLAMVPRYWRRMGGGGAEDDNPDILNFLGHGEIEMLYYHAHYRLSMIARTRSLQFDFGVPMRALYIQNANLHLQYFHGYGESLIDYNQAHTTYGIGLSIPFEDKQ